MLTADLLDVWLMNATGGSVDLVIGVTASIPCLLQSKEEKAAAI